MCPRPPDISRDPLKRTLKRFCVVVIFGIAFGYIEAAVVVYLRAIFHPDGFTFPLRDFPISQHGDILLTEIGREAATLVLILAGSWLMGRNLQQRLAYIFTIFAVWDIFYYIWLKILINWPSSIMDWDILFLIPVTWAGPTLAPILISFTLLLFGIMMLYRSSCGAPLRATLIDWLGFFLVAVAVVVSFCVAGQHITKPDFRTHFYWPVFTLGNIAAIGLFLKCFLRS